MIRTRPLTLEQWPKHALNWDREIVRNVVQRPRQEPRHVM